MLQKVCVHQGKRNRFFIMEHQNVPTFVNAVKEARRDDIFVVGPIEFFDPSNFLTLRTLKFVSAWKWGLGY